MANRKSGKDLRKEYQDLLDKTKAMQKRLIKRADELVQQYPDVVYIKNNFPTGKPLTVGQYQKGYRIAPQNALSIIELHIANQHPHQQLNLYKVDVVPAPPVGERVLFNGSTGEAYMREKPRESNGRYAKINKS